MLVTFYASVDQLPPFLDYSMKNRTYRYFHGTPVYGFGYGFELHHFDYRNMHVSNTNLKAGEPFTVEADVRNMGSLPGDDVVELYLTRRRTESVRCASLRILRAFTLHRENRSM